MTNNTNHKHTRHVDRLTQAISYDYIASDYYRREQAKKKRLIIDICIFFFLGILFVIFADLATAQTNGCQRLDCLIRSLNEQNEARTKERERRGPSVWLEQDRQPLEVIVGGNLQVEHSERSIFSPPSQPIQIQIQRPTRQEFCVGCDRRGGR